jgi:hypothetical protein
VRNTIFKNLQLCPDMGVVDSEFGYMGDLLLVSSLPIYPVKILTLRLALSICPRADIEAIDESLRAGLNSHNEHAS